MKISISQTAMNCADGVLCSDSACFLGYQNLIRAIKTSWLLALLTTMKIPLILTPEISPRLQVANVGVSDTCYTYR